MNATPLFHSLAAVILLLTSGCALLSRPAPLVTLQLEPPPAASTWPATLKPGRVSAVAALQSDRVVVADGALLMQHQGLRWVEAPAVMVAEYLHRIHATRSAGAVKSEPGIASLDLWLTDFNLRLDTEGRRSVIVAASAELRCASVAAVHPLGPAVATQALTEGNASEIAAAFSAAVHELVAALLSTALQQAAPCAVARDAGNSVEVAIGARTATSGPQVSD